MIEKENQHLRVKAAISASGDGYKGHRVAFVAFPNTIGLQTLFAAQNLRLCLLPSQTLLVFTSPHTPSLVLTFHFGATTWNLQRTSPLWWVSFPNTIYFCSSPIFFMGINLSLLQFGEPSPAMWNAPPLVLTFHFFTIGTLLLAASWPTTRSAFIKIWHRKLL